MDQPALYVAIAVVALVAALWLTLMILGFFFKALFLALIVVVAVAVFRSWSSAPRGSARR